MRPENANGTGETGKAFFVTTTKQMPDRTGDKHTYIYMKSKMRLIERCYVREQLNRALYDKSKSFDLGVQSGGPFATHQGGGCRGDRYKGT